MTLFRAEANDTRLVEEFLRQITSHWNHTRCLTNIAWCSAQPAPLAKRAEISLAADACKHRLVHFNAEAINECKNRQLICYPLRKKSAGHSILSRKIWAKPTRVKTNDKFVHKYFIFLREQLHTSHVIFVVNLAVTLRMKRIKYCNKKCSTTLSQYLSDCIGISRLRYLGSKGT